METNRTSLTALGWLIIALSFSSATAQQQTMPDSLPRYPQPFGDTLGSIQPPADTSSAAQDSLARESALEDSLARTMSKTSWDSLSLGITEAESTVVSAYTDRTILARGPADELKRVPNYFVISPGAAGSPAIPVRYLNTSGAEIRVNGLPFLYNGLYRPYAIGVDLNTIPWEILNAIAWNPRRELRDGLDISLGAPGDRGNRSDVEVARGPFGYNGTRWRFFRPFGETVYSYFTLGFKKSRGHIQNSDYNGFHVTGGLSRKFKTGELALNLWRHRAKGGLNSFDFSAEQLSRQSRGIDRAELLYMSQLFSPISLNLAGFFQRSAQTIYGYTDQIKSKLDIGGGKAVLSDSLGSNAALTAGLNYYNIRLYGVYNKKPNINVVELTTALEVAAGPLTCDIRPAYAWNEIDHGAFLPSARLSLGADRALSPYITISRSRRLPDPFLLYFNDAVGGLGLPGILESYRFAANGNLSSPLTSQAVFGIEYDGGSIKSSSGISYNRIESQIYLQYANDPPGAFTVTPVNYGDNFIEAFTRTQGEAGPFSGEISAAVRKWNKRFFADGLEKGPIAFGSARLSFLREVFIPRLYLGASGELRISSRRDYRSLTPGLTDGFAVLFGRLEFRYKDFTFWLNEDNLLNSGYITWWNYYEQPRSIWWGFRWEFFN